MPYEEGLFGGLHPLLVPHNVNLGSGGALRAHHTPFGDTGHIPCPTSPHVAVKGVFPPPHLLPTSFLRASLEGNSTFPLPEQPRSFWGTPPSPPPTPWSHPGMWGGIFVLPPSSLVVLPLCLSIHCPLVSRPQPLLSIKSFLFFSFFPALFSLLVTGGPHPACPNCLIRGLFEG